MTDKTRIEELEARTRTGDIVAAVELADLAALEHNWPLLKLAADVLVGDAVWVLTAQKDRIPRDAFRRLVVGLDDILTGEKTVLVLEHAKLQLVSRPSAPLGEPVTVQVTQGWVETDDDTVFSSTFGCIRACLDCGVLVTGGPTRCCACVREIERRERESSEAQRREDEVKWAEAKSSIYP